MGGLLGFLGLGGGDTKQTATTNWTDASTKTNEETYVTGSGMNISGGGDVTALRDNATLIQGMTINESLDAGVVSAALDTVRASNAAIAGTAQGAFDAAGTFVDANAKLAGQSMDTALAFAQNAKPPVTSFTDTIPILALAAAAAAVAYFIFKK